MHSYLTSIMDLIDNRIVFDPESNEMYLTNAFFSINSFSQSENSLLLSKMF